jgi:hypothetical protein
MSLQSGVPRSDAAGEHHVFRFDVSVCVALRVTVVQSHEQLVEQARNKSLRRRLLIWLQEAVATPAWHVL